MGKHKSSDLESAFRRMAEEYTEQYGANLRSELDALSRQPEMITPGLDAKVQFAVRAAKRKRTSHIMGILAVGAACFVLVFAAPLIYRQSLPQQAPDSDAAMEYPGAPAEAPLQEADTAYEVIPLAAELPANFSVSAIEQDVGKTIYHLDNTELDNAIVTLQYADKLPDVSELNEYEINGQPVYGKYSPDYSVLIFQKDDILYELTSRYDINTLVELGTAIL